MGLTYVYVNVYDPFGPSGQLQQLNPVLYSPGLAHSATLIVK